MLDLSAFGFTSTESRAYGALLVRGPSTGYAIARELSVARANAYQALEGLIAKGAALLQQENPRKYRAVPPATLLALLGQRHAQALEALSAQLARFGDATAPVVHRFRGAPEFQQVALQLTVRAHSVACVAPPNVLLLLNPLWRKRTADGRPPLLWVAGETAPEGLVGAVSGTAPDLAPMILVAADTSTVIGELTDDGPEGLWSADKLLAKTAQLALGTIGSRQP